MLQRKETRSPLRWEVIMPKLGGWTLEELQVF